ncbi:glycoprotein hormone alpha-2 [Anguilla anguilla]|nr:glycoprotein hormone alpha-2 [Anguilla anguilla]
MASQDNITPGALRLSAMILMSPRRTLTPGLFLLLLPLFLLMLLAPFGRSYSGLGPGCHLFPFNVTIRSDRRGTCRGTHTVYACVGYCESSAFPSRYSVLAASNFTHNITSASRCCTISKDTKVKVRLDCPRGRRHDNIEILTARACRCDMCRKSRY